MRIVITGRHVGVTQAMKDYARGKIEKLEHIYGRLTKVEVTLGVVHDANVVEIVADANRGARLVGKAESPDMYAAVDMAEGKLAHQLHKHKERLTDHHRRAESPGGVPPPDPDGAVGARDGVAGGDGARPGSPPPDSPPLESYEDVIDRLGDE